jgi:general secretion pathway protein G
MILRREVRRSRRAAFTLMEMLVVVAIIVALAGIGGFFLMKQLSGAQNDVAATQVKGPLTNAVQAYKVKNHQYPQSLQQLLQPDAKGNIYIEEADALIDPWQQPYKYDPSGPNNGGRRPDIWTVSPEGITIGNWSTNK